MVNNWTSLFSGVSRSYAASWTTCCYTTYNTNEALIVKISRIYMQARSFSGKHMLELFYLHRLLASYPKT